MKRTILILLAMALFIPSISFSNETMCCASDYEIHIKVPSVILGGIYVADQGEFICPADKSIVLPFIPKHGEQFECGGHAFIIWGNSIEIVK